MFKDGSTGEVFYRLHVSLNKLEQTEVVGYGIRRMFEIPDAIDRRLIVLGSGQPHAIFE